MLKNFYIRKGLYTKTSKVLRGPYYISSVLFAYLQCVGRQTGTSALIKVLIKSGVQGNLITSLKDPFPLSFPTIFSSFMQRSRRKKVLVGNKPCMFFLIGDNVLLDKCRLRAKLADFGVAKGIGVSQSDKISWEECKKKLN